MRDDDIVSTLCHFAGGFSHLPYPFGTLVSVFWNCSIKRCINSSIGDALPWFKQQIQLHTGAGSLQKPLIKDMLWPLKHKVWALTVSATGSRCSVTSNIWTVLEAGLFMSESPCTPTLSLVCRALRWAWKEGGGGGVRASPWNTHLGV